MFIYSNHYTITKIFIYWRGTYFQFAPPDHSLTFSCSMFWSKAANNSLLDGFGQWEILVGHQKAEGK